MKFKANAKINWSLKVVNKRKDGYHNLDMVMQSISLCDYVAVNESDNDLVKLINFPDFYFGENNICLKAINLFNQITGYKSKFEILIDKHIPVGGGLGGGSGNVAAVLFALNYFYKTNMSTAELQKIGFKIGADVPFMLNGGLAKVEGIGEIIKNYEDTNKHALLVVNNGKEILTKDVFSKHLINNKEKINSDFTIKNILSRNYNLLQNYAKNSLQLTANNILPEINEAINDLYFTGAIFATMSGSGSTVFGVFDSIKLAEIAQSKLLDKWKICEVCTTEKEGIEQIN